MCFQYSWVIFLSGEIHQEMAYNQQIMFELCNNDVHITSDMKLWRTIQHDAALLQKSMIALSYFPDWLWYRRQQDKPDMRVSYYNVIFCTTKLWYRKWKWRCVKCQLHYWIGWTKSKQCVIIYSTIFSSTTMVCGWIFNWLSKKDDRNGTVRSKLLGLKPYPHWYPYQWI